MEKIAIRGLGHSGEGVGSILDSNDKYTIFVDGALPGEIVEASLFEQKKTYGKAKLLKILQTSPNRVDPVCPLFGTCGGCQIMHLSYPAQLEIKRQRVSDALKRIGKIECDVDPCIPSPNPLHYRNKMQMPVRKGSKGLKIGLYAKNSHDLVDVDKCYIHAGLGEGVYEKVREILLSSPIEELSHLMIKSAVHTGDVLVVFVTRDYPTPLLRKLARKVMENCPEVKGVVHNLQPELSNVILGRRYETLAGAAMIHEELLGLRFKVSPASFFQVNPFQAENLYQKALEFAELTGDERVLDAFCGVGTLSLFAAKFAEEVIGIECVAEAIDDAKENAAMNGIHNVNFITDYVEKAIAHLLPFSHVFLNPPRQGCEKEVLNALSEMKPKTIIYISCDPATLARDLSVLTQGGYVIEKVQPLDMFPQTAHVETVVKLSFGN